MITLTQYFIGRPHSSEQESCAIELLGRVNQLRTEYPGEVPLNVHTNSRISGLTEGGFRLPDCTQGAALSSHKEAKAVDVYDPEDKLDGWITDLVLEKYDLYREHPDSTHGWCHLTIRPPKSGHRTFQP